MSDKLNIAELAISEQVIDQQVENLKNGPKELNLKRPCTVGDGISALSDAELNRLVDGYEGMINGKTICRFTPASGAATRMFKHLYEGDHNSGLLKEFLDRIQGFAFYEALNITDHDSAEQIVNKVLGSEGLNYGNLPKAMIDFHKYPNEVRKSIDEQLVEGVAYAKSNNLVDFHFTISEEHKEIVQEHLNKVLSKYEEKLETKINISYSTQLKSTDTVALDVDNKLVYQENGDLLLRPGGHGSLIHNLNQMDADVIYVKNIDNIVREEKQPEIIKYKKALGAKLIELQTTVFKYLNELETQEVLSDRLSEMADFIREELNVDVSANQEEIFQKLNRPIRVCGMVKNEGKAGGGPFWVDDSVQIVESAQMNLDKPEVLAMLENATHFNPVDLVCGIKDYKGHKFNLADFIDPETFFVASKSYMGKEIKVLEHPGLWNGAMANWNTVFVEVPVSTFHPVKTVNDLLAEAHQA
ncbi:DUF4301 family protein [bacterium SCSIO 12643]|nr:DUF4301 family protein [bacterium SCSIO 12643]